MAVKRRLFEELNISCETKEIGSFVYFTQFDNLCEYEYDHIFIGEYSKSICFNKKEINDVQWISIDELNRMILDKPTMFSSWFLTAYPEVLKFIKESN